VAAPLNREPTVDVQDELLVYRLVEPQTILDAASIIETAIITSCPLTPISPELSISPQGCMRFVDHGAIVRSGSPALLPRTDQAAATIAREFLSRANAAVNQATDGHIRDLFQLTRLQHGTTKLYHSPQTREPDFWLSTWLLSLPSRSFGRHEPAAVIGGTVHVRVGDDGRVIGLNSAVRPIVGSLNRKAFPFTSHDNTGHHDHTEQSPIIVYVAEGPDSPQHFLSPCYVDPDALDSGKHASKHGLSMLWPACDHTLIPQIGVFQREDGATVRALIIGPGGKLNAINRQREYRVLWGIANQSEFIEGEFKAEESTALELAAPGLYHVELTVEHVESECIATTYAHIPVLGKANLPPRPEDDRRFPRTTG
jgi:hypothetical protein